MVRSVVVIDVVLGASRRLVVQSPSGSQSCQSRVKASHLETAGIVHETFTGPVHEGRYSASTAAWCKRGSRKVGIQRMWTKLWVETTSTQGADVFSSDHRGNGRIDEVGGAR